MKPFVLLLFLPLITLSVRESGWSAEQSQINKAEKTPDFLPVEGKELDKILSELTDAQRAAVRFVVRIGMSTVLIQLGAVRGTNLMGGILVMKNDNGLWSLVSKEDWIG
jgi:hypothetical protein